MMLKQVLKKNASKQFMNLNGDPIIFKMNKFDDTGCAFVIKNTAKDTKYKMFVVTFLIIMNFANIAFNFAHLAYSVIVYFLTMFLLYMIATTVVRESFLVIPSLGYQIDTWYKYSHSTKFIPWEHITDIVINEVIRRHQVIFVLTALTKDDTIIPLFTGSQPRLDVLELIYKKIYKLQR